MSQQDYILEKGQWGLVAQGYSDEDHWDDDPWDTGLPDPVVTIQLPPTEPEPPAPPETLPDLPDGDWLHIYDLRHNDPQALGLEKTDVANSGHTWGTWQAGTGFRWELDDADPTVYWHMEIGRPGCTLIEGGTVTWMRMKFANFLADFVYDAGPIGYVTKLWLWDPDRGQYGGYYPYVVPSGDLDEADAIDLFGTYGYEHDISTLVSPWNCFGYPYFYYMGWIYDEGQPCIAEPPALQWIAIGGTGTDPFPDDPSAFGLIQ